MVYDVPLGWMGSCYMNPCTHPCLFWVMRHMLEVSVGGKLRCFNPKMFLRRHMLLKWIAVSSAEAGIFHNHCPLTFCGNDAPVEEQFDILLVRKELLKQTKTSIALQNCTGARAFLSITDSTWRVKVTEGMVLPNSLLVLVICYIPDFGFVFPHCHRRHQVGTHLRLSLPVSIQRSWHHPGMQGPITYECNHIPL